MTEANANTTTDDEANSDGDTTPADENIAVGTKDVEMRQFAAVTGIPSDDGYLFRLTKPLSLAGLTVDDLRGSMEAMLYLSEPDPEQGVLTAALAVGEDLPGGRRGGRYRRIRNNRSTLTSYLKDEEIDAIGVDYSE